MKLTKNTKLIWDHWNKGHIKKHRVSVKEVGEIFRIREVVKKSYKGRLIVVGRTNKKRFLTLVISFGRKNQAYVVSARDSGRKERRVYNEEVKT